MNTGNKPWILHNDQDCPDEIVGPPNCLRPVVSLVAAKNNAVSKRVDFVIQSLQSIKRVVRVRPQRFGTCTTCTPSLIPSLPTPERDECFVWQDETGRPALHLSRRDTTTASPSTQTGLALSGTARRPAGEVFINLKCCFAAQGDRLAAVHWSERPGWKPVAGCDAFPPCQRDLRRDYDVYLKYTAAFIHILLPALFRHLGASFWLGGMKRKRIQMHLKV